MQLRQTKGAKRANRILAVLRRDRFLKIVSVMLASVFLFSAFMTGTYAWRDAEQHKTNVLSGETREVTVLLQKYEKDAQGNVTAIPVPDATFQLYRVADAPEAEDTLAGDQALYTTDTNGHIVVRGLEPGNYYFLEVFPGVGYAFDVDAQGNTINKYYFTVQETDNDEGVTAVTAYNRRLFGSLVITKTVENLNEIPLMPYQEELSFTFQITFSDEGTYTYSIYDAADELVKTDSLASGGTLNLRHGEYAVFNDIPSGITYEVIEINVPAGYAVSADNHLGTIPEKEEGEEEAEPVHVDYVNTCTYADSLHIQKEVTGTAGDETKEFEFTVVFNNDADTAENPVKYYYTVDGGSTYQWIYSGGKIRLTHGQTAVFPLLSEDISYTVTEASYADDGYTTQQFSWIDPIGVGSRHWEVFVNNCDEEEPPEETGNLTIEKTIVGTDDPDLDQEFVFTVFFSQDGEYSYSIDGGEAKPIKSGDKIILKHGQKAVISGLPVGSGFVVVEDDYAAKGYHSMPRCVSGNVLADNSATAVFKNKKCEQEDKDATLTIQKKVVGAVPAEAKNQEFNFRAIIGGKVYNFTLKDGESITLPLPYGAAYVVREKWEMHDGFAPMKIHHGIGFGCGKDITVTQINKYIKKIYTEIEGEKTWDLSTLPKGLSAADVMPKSIVVFLRYRGIVIDQQIVKPNQDGKWVYRFTVPKFANDNVTLLEYTVDELPVPGFKKTIDGLHLKNTYIDAEATYDPVVKKKVYCDTPETPEDFKFQLEAKNNAPMPENSQNGKAEITISGAGTKAFDSITYVKPGTYTYKITEIKGNTKGYEYDNSTYTLQVKVGWVEEELKVVSAVYRRAGDIECYALAEFINKYITPEKPEPEPGKKIAISGYKTWLHGANNPESYPQQITVYVKTADGSTVATREISARDGWRWEFELDQYDEAGKEIQYYVDEAPLAGYEKKIDGYNIINTHTGIIEKETVTISGTKHWDHKDNPKADQPESVEVLVCAGDNIVAKKTVSAADDWQYEFVLPKYNEAGKEIVYTISETAVEDYGCYVNGYDLYNTYQADDGEKPSDLDDPDDPDDVETGLRSRLIRWTIILCSSAVALVLLGMYYFRKKRRSM